MQTSAVYPQNYAVNQPTVERYPDAGCAPSKRCVRLIVFLAVVTLLLVCAIVIPLVLSKKCDKKTSETTTTTQSTESTRAPAISDRTTTTTTKTNGWTTDMMNTRVSNTDATEKTTATVSIDSHTKVTAAAATTTSSMIRLNGVKDVIIGLDNTVAGGPTVGTYSNPNGTESPMQAMDGKFNTKYFNSQAKSDSSQTAGKGIGSGFIVVPSISNSTMAHTLRFYPANDMPGRDPITVTLEGSNATDTDVLHSNSTWTLIYNGTAGIGDRNLTTPLQYGELQDLNNTIRFASYRLLVTSKRNSTMDGVQYAEAEIFGDTFN